MIQPKYFLGSVSNEHELKNILLELGFCASSGDTSNIIVNIVYYEDSSVGIECLPPTIQVPG